MSEIRIEPIDDLRAIAFKVCTALHRAGTTAVLTGGSAATVYAPEVHQSRDVDFITYVVRDAADLRQAIVDLGYLPTGRIFAHPAVAITLDFPDQDIRIGSDVVDRYATLVDGDYVLHILTPTDCVRDRLASFFWFHDRSALRAACGVTRAKATQVDLATISDWATQEGVTEEFQEFLEKLERG